MSNKDLINILRILNTDGIGPVSFYKYIKEAGSIEAALEKIKEKKEIPGKLWAEDEIENADKHNVKIITVFDDLYPEKLKQLNDAPPVLYALGNVELLKYPVSVAIVGARNATISGRKIASHIAYDLTENEVLVVSGMAKGIDSAAHKGALYAHNQQGATIAVLGTGIDIVYPIENEGLYKQIAEQGLIISEFAMKTAAQVSNFPRRNRIISGITDGTVVVEAGVHSGSLITARLALEQGKDIFAVPGAPSDSRSAGPNHLIKEGAVLTENADDILNVLSVTQNQQIKNYQSEVKPLDKPKNNVNISTQEKNNKPIKTAEGFSLIDLITYEGVDIDELMRNCPLSQAEFFSQILELEFDEKIQRQAGNKLVRIK